MDGWERWMEMDRLIDGLIDRSLTFRIMGLALRLVRQCQNNRLVNYRLKIVQETWICELLPLDNCNTEKQTYNRSLDRSILRDISLSGKYRLNGPDVTGAFSCILH